MNQNVFGPIGHLHVKTHRCMETLWCLLDMSNKQRQTHTQMIANFRTQLKRQVSPRVHLVLTRDLDPSVICFVMQGLMHTDSILLTRVAIHELVHEARWRPLLRSTGDSGVKARGVPSKACRHFPHMLIPDRNGLDSNRVRTMWKAATRSCINRLSLSSCDALKYTFSTF